MSAPGNAGRCSIAALALVLGAAATPPAVRPDAPAGAQAMPAGEDQAARLTIPVMVNGRGPFEFLVDTGAERSVISRELAAVLKLPAGPRVTLHSTAGAEQEDTAIIDRLSFGRFEATDIRAPLLAAAGMGAPGILGLDSLHGHLVTMDFDARRFLVRTASESLEERGPFDVVVQGRRRFGQLVLVDADSQSFPILVILDSGAQNTVGNLALRRRLGSEKPPKDPKNSTAEVISVTGSRTQVGLDVVPRLQLGGIQLRHVPIAYADLHVFEQLHLQERPAMLVGMDVLHLFRSVTIDFRRREAVFVPR
jgi:predicted aspartyl protease